MVDGVESGKYVKQGQDGNFSIVDVEVNVIVYF